MPYDDARPNRKEEMSKETVDTIIAFIDANPSVISLDFTGGAPELNPHFQHLVIAAGQQNIHVIDRCNLTILEQPGHEDLGNFLARHQVEVVASLPCYLEDNVNQQRGRWQTTATDALPVKAQVAVVLSTVTQVLYIVLIDHSCFDYLSSIK